DPQASAEKNVVLLAAGNRVAQITIAHRELPGKPLADGCDCRDVKICTIRPGIREIREENESLLNRGGASELVRQVLAQQKLGRGAVQPGREKFTVGRGAHPKIELRGHGRNGMI